MIAPDTPIRTFMSPGVRTIEIETSLPVARQVMDEAGVRHLPVVDRGRIVGLLSERELGKLEGFPMVDLNVVSVPDAMTIQPFVVGPDTPIADVLETMLERRIGSAVVVVDDMPIGMFTTHDVVRVLFEQLTA
jgi:acetoin utilization protein AcuB